MNNNEILKVKYLHYIININFAPEKNISLKAQKFFKKDLNGNPIKRKP